MPNVLVLSGPALPLLKMAEEMKPDGYDLSVCTPETDPEEVDRIASNADFVLAFGHGVTENILRAGQKLKLVQLCSAGYDGVNLQVAGELGIPVANNGGANAVPVAEFAMTLILACHRHLPIAHNDTRADAWMRPEIDGYDSYELFGKTVGIVGAGRIGSTLARLLRGFETNTLYTDLVLSEEAERYGARRVELDELLAESDVVSLHTSLNATSQKLIGARELGLMKKSALLVNTCRGPVVDEAALIGALRNGEIWGAGLDVFEIEPIKADNPLLTMDNVVVAPHVAGKSWESYPRRVDFAFSNMQRVWQGDAPESVVTEI
jgi:phosphoglycerate dehydrogenase-like enzyme